MNLAVLGRPGDGPRAFITPTGGFKSTTVAALRDFQTQHGLEPAGLGEVTDATWDLLVTPLGTDSTGDAVTGLQRILQPKGYQVSVTGTYDAQTVEAVQQMQLLHNLPVAGTVDLATWCAVAGGIVRQEFLGVLRA